MNAETLRRLLSDAEIERLFEADGEEATAGVMCGILGRLAGEERIFEATRLQRERAARLAAAFLDKHETEEGLLARLQLARGRWYERAAAAEELMRNSAWIPAGVFGSSAPPPQEETEPRSRSGLDAAAAKALVVALRETLLPEVAERQEQLNGIARAALRNELEGEDVWETALQPLLGHYAGHARATGASRQAAALKTLAGTAILKGEAMCDDEEHRAVALALGHAATEAVRAKPKKETEELRALGMLVSALSRQNEARASFWETEEAEIARFVGASASVAAFGRGNIRVPATNRMTGGTMAFSLPEAWHERFSHMAAVDAAAAFEALADGPRASETERRMAEALAERLRACAAPHELSFSQALGIPPVALREGVFRHGHPIFRASLRAGSPTVIVCRGTRGRTLRCRAVVDADGAFVGYRAFDPLSREMGGKPLYALYGLDGRRGGYAWAQDPVIVQSGTPKGGFMTAPDVIPL